MTEIRKIFHEDLAELRADVIHLGAMAGEAIQAATDALLETDLAAVERVAASDRAIDALDHTIEEHVYLLLARQQPMASDLRSLVAVLRVIHEIERIGDLMVKVAKATRRLYPEPLDPRVRGLVDRMRDQAGAQLRLAVDAYAELDLAKAQALPDMDDVLDELQKDLFQAIFARHGTDDAAVRRAVQLALIGRFYERVGDHATNIADRVTYMITGHFPYEEMSNGI
ncbi:MAG: phosphate signaling complex protein PhoU [Acidimicrobiales bacterium]